MTTADLFSFVTYFRNKSLEICGKFQIMALDISKAFDEVWHETLLDKLPAFDLFPKILNLGF